MVQKLIPAVAPDMKGPADVAVAEFDYHALDREEQVTRLRLNSTVVGVREIDLKETDGKRVEVDMSSRKIPCKSPPITAFWPATTL